MKKTLTTYEVAGVLMGDKNAGWSRDGAYALAEYLEQYEEDTGEELELDIVAIRCDYSEYSSALEAANDYGFENVFSRQIEAIANEHDCIIAFSTSGKSPNVIKGLDVATKKAKNIYLITGLDYVHDSMSLWKYIALPSHKTTIVQEMHLWLIHALSEYCESQLI